MLLRACDSGDAVDAEVEFGSSEYAKEILGELWGFPPALEIEKEAALQKAIVELISAGLIDSAHDCSDGGLAVALARVSFEKGVGCRVELRGSGLVPEFVLFGEDAGRIVISCDPAHLTRIKEVAKKYGIFADELGETVPGSLEIKIDGKAAVSGSVSDFNERYEGSLERALRSDSALVAAD
jgi:phosphoribosylformylglycinamidine synthase